MKKLIVTLAVALFGFAAAPAFSQGNFSLRADVPFAFSIDGHQYAAGPYELRTINSSIVHLINVQTGDSGLFVTRISEYGKSRGNGAAPVLRFQVNGEHAYLESMTDRDGNGWQVPVAARDLELARQAARQSRSTNIVVALK